jgi:hypothetical protein
MAALRGATPSAMIALATAAAVPESAASSAALASGVAAAGLDAATSNFAPGLMASA